MRTFAIIIVVAGLLVGCSPEETATGDAAADSAAAVQRRLEAIRETFVDPGVCPFECCQYTEWTARDAIAAYAAERDTSTVAFLLLPSERFTGITGNVHMNQVGIAVAQDTVATNIGSPEGPHFIPPGDTVYVLSTIAEGFYHLLHEGQTVEGYGFWTFNPMENLEPQGQLLQEPIQEWWAQIRNSEGQVGWLNMTRLGGRVGGVDACAGPEPLYGS
jgi:hypothetical protein